MPEECLKIQSKEKKKKKDIYFFSPEMAAIAFNSDMQKPLRQMYEL